MKNDEHDALTRALGIMGSAITVIAFVHDSAIVEVNDPQLMLARLDEAGVELNANIAVTTFASGQCEVTVKAKA